MKQKRSAAPFFKETLLIASIPVMLASATIGPAMPALRDSFLTVPNIDVWVRLIVTLPALFIGITAPFAGKLITRTGRKNMLVGSLILYGMAGASAYLAQALWGIVLGRILLGIAVAGLMTSVTTLIADCYQGKERSRLLGLQAGFMGIGGTIFFALGGLLAVYGWREPFLIYLIGLAIVPLVILIVREPGRDQAALQQTYPLADPGNCAGEARCIEAFMANRSKEQDRRGSNQLMWLIIVLMALVQLVFFLIPVQMPFYLEAKGIGTAAQSGLAVAVIAFAFALSSVLIFGRINTKLGPFSLLSAALAIMGLGYLFIWWATTFSMLFIGLIVAGIGLGIAVPQLTFWMSNEAGTAERARALGGLISALFFGRFLSSLVGLQLGALVGIGMTFVLAAALLLILALALPFGARLRNAVS